MRKIKIFEHISLDGVIEHEDGYVYGAWTSPYRSPDGLAVVLEASGPSFDLLLGRHTYDLWSSYWPEAGNNPMANRLNAATKYVATHRPQSLRWGPVKDVGPDIIEGIHRLKSTDGPDLIVWGSSTLTPVLLGAGLVDEVVRSFTRSCSVAANASFRAVSMHANSLSSARRPRPPASSSTLIALLDRCENNF